MGIHIRNGTPQQGASLCETCSLAHIARGHRQNEEVVVCQATYFEHMVPFPVRECTSHIDKSRQDLEAMEETARILEPRGPKRKAGFVSGSDYPADEKPVELIGKRNVAPQPGCETVPPGSRTARPRNI